MTAPDPNAPPPRRRWLLSHLDGGELGNRLVTYAWLYALSREYRAPFINLGFWRYARFFEIGDAWIVRPWETPPPARPGAIRRSADAMLRLLRKAPPLARWIEQRCRFDGDVLWDFPSLSRRACAFLSSRACRSALARPWIERFAAFQHDGVPGRPAEAFTLATPRDWRCPIDDPSLVERHAAAIRAHLRPVPAIRERVDAFLQPLRARHRALVGVHIRRGDYRVYRGGRWYYEDDVYRAVMEAFERQLGRDVGFVIASNAPIESGHFAPLAVAQAPGHLVVDMLSLAGCDYIAGPPSTFSGCASFLGAKPIFWMTDAGARPAVPDALTRWVPRLY